MITVTNVHKRFGSQSVLSGMNFSVGKGNIVGLLGPNGSGKTTMIRLLNGVIKPEQGTMEINGFSPATDGNVIRQMSGIVTEGAGLYHEMSGTDNLLFFSEIYGVRKGRERVDELLKEFDLYDHRHKKVGTYSTGMKKRLALAKALLHKPKILFLDEPTNGLDPDGIRDVLGYLARLNKNEQTTIIICSHVLQQLEDICHSYVFMEEGRVLAAGTRQQLDDDFLTNVMLRVETGLKLDDTSYFGHPVERIGETSLLFTLSSKGEISPLLREILKETWIHSTIIENVSLESIYFEVRRRNNE
ncbi:MULTISPECIES: ABC transporter ATP-binding protein [Metabacillus]|uniref:ABC transporter ATP-binding protein n=1 Tax=Metabacillus rhizolycopersici TaxID=2875709 RepID=A0ABS7UP22_9BACI|nr:MULTISPECIES: ABC transporter ATP-binding protein [Metabacillus]MBZ5750051.1 ABC transporter ATP-binding protein [Metabacillus rhizolycopersici]MCM3653162.1 ABC transporter ATP-binding protein [Metabacillus litoralis]